MPPSSLTLAMVIAAFALTHCGDSEGGKKHKLKPKGDQSKFEQQQQSSREPNTVKDAGTEDEKAPSGPDSETEDEANGELEAAGATEAARANPTASVRNEVNFEQLTLSDAIALSWLNFNVEVPGKRAGALSAALANHNWKVRVTYLGYTRGRAYTYLNGEKIDSVHIYLDEDESTDDRKVYEYTSEGGLSNLGGATFSMNLRVVHDRAAGKCFVDFYRYSSFSSAYTLGPRSRYEGLETKCPTVARSLVDEIAFTKQNWELTGRAYYDGYLTNPTYEVLARVESYEFAAPWIRVFAGVDPHAYLSYSLDVQASKGPLRVYRHRNGDRRSTFTKNISTGQCTFSLTDANFNQGMQLSGDCSTK